ncbi:CLUMA_CG000264, isoform A [Clunio marinus]|uniref:CLUMA_CG000264, isoform A n=1 Tax=Clunio marinus TaxID=568069 RepID=A0A1J1HEH9_9DIPT|nr:CLUMA_CG000264, isoform A [Clunio marinus]
MALDSTTFLDSSELTICLSGASIKKSCSLRHRKNPIFHILHPKRVDKVFTPFVDSFEKISPACALAVCCHVFFFCFGVDTFTFRFSFFNNFTAVATATGAALSQWIIYFDNINFYGDKLCFSFGSAYDTQGALSRSGKIELIRSLKSFPFRFVMFFASFTQLVRLLTYSRERKTFSKPFSMKKQEKQPNPGYKKNPRLNCVDETVINKYSISFSALFRLSDNVNKKTC